MLVGAREGRRIAERDGLTQRGADGQHAVGLRRESVVDPHQLEPQGVAGRERAAPAG